MSLKHESPYICTKRKCLTVTLDVILVGSVALCAGLVHQLMTPYHRGFYCNDESISYPFHSSTIPSSVLYGVGFGLNFLLFFIIEALWLPKTTDEWKSSSSSSSADDHENHNSPEKAPSRLIFYLCAVYNIILPFLFGAALEFLARGLTKYLLGRLRPHFLSVCQPDPSTFNCSTGYIEEYKCTGDPDLVYQARLSFPSGHASFSVYSMLFLIVILDTPGVPITYDLYTPGLSHRKTGGNRTEQLYIQARMRWRQAVIIRPWVQLILFLMALYTCISRIFDYKHHWSDVLAGAIWGILAAVFVVFKVSSLFPRSRYICSPSGFHHTFTTKL